MSETVCMPKKKYWLNLTANDLLAFISTMIIGVIAHLTPITNIVLNWDSMKSIMGDSSFLTGQGKWMFSVISAYLRGPWSTGALSAGSFCVPLAIFWVACMVVLLLRCFRIKRWYFIVAFSAIIVTSPSLMCLFTYSLEDVFCFAGFLCVAGAYLIINGRRLGWLFGTVVLWLGVSTYQAYLGFAVGIMLFSVILDLLTKRKPLGRALLEGLKYVGCIIAAVLAYYVSMKASLMITGQSVSGYRGIDDALGSFDMLGIIKAIPDAYMYVVDYLLYDKVGLSDPASYWVFRGMLVIGAVSFLALIVKYKAYKRPVSMLLSIALLALLPLAVHIIGALSQKDDSHWLMLFPVMLLFVFPLVQVDMLCADKAEDIRTDGAVIKRGQGRGYGALLASTIAVCCMLLFNQTYVLSAGYTCNQLTYQNALNTCYKVYDDLMDLDGYTAETPVVLIGAPSVNSESLAYMGNYTGITVKRYFLTETHMAKFMQNYMNLDINYVGKKADIVQNDRCLSMPAYPQSGYVRMIDGTACIKMSDDSAQYANAILSKDSAKYMPNYAVGSAGMQAIKTDAPLGMPLSVSKRFLSNAKGQTCVLTFEMNLSNLRSLSGVSAALTLSYTAGGEKKTVRLNASGYDVAKGGRQQLSKAFTLPKNATSVDALTFSASTTSGTVSIGCPMLLISRRYMTYHRAMENMPTYGQELLSDAYTGTYTYQAPEGRKYAYLGMPVKLESGAAYTLSIPKWSVAKGDFDLITVSLYDGTSKQIYATSYLNKGESPHKVNFAIPSGISTGNLRVLIYPGMPAETAGNAVTLKNMSMKMVTK